MVKNTGGNKAKKFASKTFNVVVKATRFASVDGEVYAIVTKMMGGSICEVLCIDGNTRQCVIRRKFSGKGKRDNWLCSGKWILVGLRDWEKTSKTKETCDLLEVYSDNDKEKLIKNSKDNFRIFLSVVGDDNEEHNSEIDFINSREKDLFENENDKDDDEEDDKDDKDDDKDDKDDDDKDDKDDGSWYDEIDEHDENYKNELDPQPHKISSILNNISLIDINDI
jgi:initiation factor 1A